jgi:hypothetical protein
LTDVEKAVSFRHPQPDDCVVVVLVMVMVLVLVLVLVLL